MTPPTKWPALHFTLPPDRLHPAFATLSREWNGADRKRGYQLNVANALHPAAQAGAELADSTPSTPNRSSAP